MQANINLNLVFIILLSMLQMQRFAKLVELKKTKIILSKKPKMFNFSFFVNFFL